MCIAGGNHLEVGGGMGVTTPAAPEDSQQPPGDPPLHGRRVETDVPISPFIKQHDKAAPPARACGGPGRCHRMPAEARRLRGGTQY